eukprot:scaffold687_cov77-Cylindrotheca_fusiformis.AAC.1
MEAENQIIGHLAKHVGVGFQFRGVGVVDTIATGVAMTPSCMRIIQLELVDVCRPERFEGSTKLSDCGKLKSELYPTIEEKSDVPGGITALWNIMSCNRRALVGPSKINDDDGGEEGRVDAMISFGAYATIHKIAAPKGADEEIAKIREDQVMKLSRFGPHSLLEREAGILQELAKRAIQEGTSQVLQQSIVTCVEFNKEEPMTVHNDKMKEPALVLSPRGMSSRGFMKTECNSGKVLNGWSGQLSSALCHIHRLGFFHNDISPKNIMVKVDADAHHQPFLIDFAFASEKDEYNVGFVGTPRYTHSDIFEKYPNETWQSKPEYDFCALALSLATLAAQGLYLWDSFPPSNYCFEDEDLLESWVVHRGDVAWGRLQHIAGLNKSPWKNRCYCTKDSS